VNFGNHIFNVASKFGNADAIAGNAQPGAAPHRPDRPGNPSSPQAVVEQRGVPQALLKRENHTLLIVKSGE
jgi:hypothetical protein